MSIKVKTVKDDFYKMGKSFESLNGTSVDVGVLEGEHAWLAAIHEYGCNIKAKNRQYLTVPLIPEAVGKKARSFTNLFVYTSKKGNKFLARSVNNSLELVYWLTPSVTIPERSFLRAGFDKHHEEVVKSALRMMPAVIHGEMSEAQFFEEFGNMFSGTIYDYAMDLKTPEKHSITVSQTGIENPLVGATGSMTDGISYKVNR